MALFVGLLAAGTLIYSQTDAYSFDEGYHLVAAQSIMRGMRPYLDFLFPQTPVNAYWNALCFRLFGDTWHTAHAGAAILISIATLLIADYVFRRYPSTTWRLPAAVAAAGLFALNKPVVLFGSVQAYGMCLFLSTVAFRCAVLAVGQRSVWLAAGAGYCAAACAGSSLLTSLVPPVLLLWIVLRNRADNRWAKAGSFLAAGAFAISPLLWLFFQNPRVVLFNVFEYMLIYRHKVWPGAFEHDLGEWSAWIDSPQALIVAGLAITGYWWIRRHSRWDAVRRSEMDLCAWLALALCLHISTARPTFVRYYILALPYLAILAAAGLEFIASRLYSPERPAIPVLLLLTLYGGAVARTLISSHQTDMSWREYEAMADKIRQVAPASAPILADEHIYLLLHRQPPSGAEVQDSHKLELPTEQEREFHMFPQSELRRRVAAGEFAVVQTCRDEDDRKDSGLPGPYSKSVEVEGCHVFWK